jgi:hypothetical protein
MTERTQQEQRETGRFEGAEQPGWDPDADNAGEQAAAGTDEEGTRGQAPYGTSDAQDSMGVNPAQAVDTKTSNLETGDQGG